MMKISFLLPLILGSCALLTPQTVDMLEEVGEEILEEGVEALIEYETKDNSIPETKSNSKMDVNKLWAR